MELELHCICQELLFNKLEVGNIMILIRELSRWIKGEEILMMYKLYGISVRKSMQFLLDDSISILL